MEFLVPALMFPGVSAGKPRGNSPKRCLTFTATQGRRISRRACIFAYLACAQLGDRPQPGLGSPGRATYWGSVCIFCRVLPNSVRMVRRGCCWTPLWSPAPPPNLQRTGLARCAGAPPLPVARAAPHQQESSTAACRASELSYDDAVPARSRWALCPASSTQRCSRTRLCRDCSACR